MSGRAEQRSLDEYVADVETPESESAGSANARKDDRETCSVLGQESGEPCGNPAILGTEFCHTHLDFTELPAAESSDEADAKPYRRRPPTASHAPRPGASRGGD